MKCARRPSIIVGICVGAVVALSLPGVPAASAVVNYFPTISGHVYDVDGNPLAGIQVREAPVDPTISDGWPGGQAAQATTDAAGYYSIEEPSPASSATLQFNDPTAATFATEYLGGGMTLTTATRIAVPEYTDVTAPDMAMHLGGSLAGSITEPDGTASANFGVQVWQQDVNLQWRIVDDAQLQSGGDAFGGTGPTWVQGKDFTSTGYLMRGFLPGDYRVCAFTEESEPQCVGDAVSAGTSTPVPIAAGSTTTTNFVMSAGGSLSGHFLDNAGVSYSWGTAVAWQFNPDLGEWAPTSANVSVTDATHGWTIPHLRPGLYKIDAAIGGVGGGFLPSMSDVTGGSTYLVTEGRTTEGIDADVQAPAPTPTPTSTPRGSHVISATAHETRPHGRRVETLSTTVSMWTPQVSGIVRFYDDKTLIGTVKSSSTGHASFTWTRARAGVHHVTAQFLPDGESAGAAERTFLVVVR